MSGTFQKSSYPVAKDDNGDPVLLCLDANGRLPVAVDGNVGTCFKTPYACVQTTETAGTPNTVDIGEVTISTGQQYNCFEWFASTNMDTVFSIVYIDDADGTPAETILLDFVLNSANSKDCCKISCLDLDTTGGTGTQKIVLRATAIDPDCLGPVMGFVALNQLP